MYKQGGRPNYGKTNEKKSDQSRRSSEDQAKMSCCVWSLADFKHARGKSAKSAKSPKSANNAAAQRAIPPPGTLNDQSPLALDTNMPSVFRSVGKLKVSKNLFTYQFLPAFNPIFQISDNPPTTKNGGEDYQGIQYHFHVPGEHPINGHTFPLVVHFVFGSEDGSTLATDLPFSITEGKSHELITDALAGRPTRFPHPFPGKQTFAYTGSLTTPPTNTNINWLVWTDHFCVNQCDLNELVRRAMVQNARELQDRNGRAVVLVQLE
jgi:carbonic anhydrase